MPLTATTTFTAELCEVCILASAGYSAHELGLSEDTIEKALSLLGIDGTDTVIDTDGDRYFSHLNCEGCGALPGTRETATITTFERNTMTHDELISAIFQSTSHDVTRHTSPDGTAAFRNGDRFFAIGEELEDDGETFWGWTWSTGVYEAFGDGEIMEYLSTDGGQDASEPLAEAICHLGAIEDNR